MAAPEARARAARRVALVPGDGIGPEVLAEAGRVLAAASGRSGLALELESFPWSADHFLATGETLPEDAPERLAREFDAVLAGAFGDPRVPDNRHAEEILLGLRRRLDLYANVRPVRCLDDRLSPLKGVGAAEIDFVVVRENTEGAYCGIGGLLRPGTPEETAIEEDVSTRRGVERLCRFAFELAGTLEGPRRRGRRPRVVLADKHNAQRFGGGLWHRVFLEVAKEHPACEAGHQFADALAHRMVLDPGSLDVVATNNLFGDLLSDVGAALQGGLGMAPSANLHPGRTSLFEPVHGSAPDLAGQGVANPFGAILTSALLLRFLGAPEASRAVTEAVASCVRAGETTRDLGGSLGTRGAGDAVLARLEAGGGA